MVSKPTTGATASTTAFERLTNRPPTPPKDHHENIDEAIRFLESDFQAAPKFRDEQEPITLTSSTARDPQEQAPSSPPSSLENSVKDRLGKKVEFSPCVTAHKPNTFDTPLKGNPLLMRLALNKDSKPLKSILKSTPNRDSPTPDSLASPGPDYFSVATADATAGVEPPSFVNMLESVVKLLAAPSLAMRLDGYRTLNGALKAYHDLPDPQALKAKMGLLVRFMIRDISASASPSASPTKNDPVSSSIATQALKLATAIPLIQSLEDCYDEDFQNFLLDKSLGVVARPEVSKIIANHHMHLLAVQRFSSKVVTAAKAERLIAALDTIHDRVTGNSVVGARLVIFQRMLEQTPLVMLSTINDWLPHIFHGSLSSIKDIRMRAVETGLQAGLALGTHYQATKAVTDLLATPTEGADTYGDYLIARLTEMTNQKDLATHVPQVWSMVVLFFRSNKSRLPRWGLFKKSWLLIIQKCMNSSDLQVKYRANLAWNRLIFVISPDKETMTSMDSIAKMLKIPFVVAFEKRDRDKQGREARQLAVSGYCHLLHYALRPSQSFEELDMYWDEYVHQVLAKLFRSSNKDTLLASRILKALFSGTSSVWNANLANEPTAMTPEQLPRLDPKWVRSRTQKILDLITPNLILVLGSPGEDSGIHKTCWSELLTAIAEAGSQEVRTSMELRDALACLMNLFGRLWKVASRDFVEQFRGMWIKRFGELVVLSISKLGALHYSEANLVRNDTETFEAAPTPSHRPSKHHAVLQSPIAFLFGLFSDPPATVSAESDYLRVAQTLLHDTCQAKVTRRARLNLLRHCSEVMAKHVESNPGLTTQANLWVVLAREGITAISQPDADQAGQESQHLGNQIRDTVHILKLGLNVANVDHSCIPVWMELYETAVSLLRKEGGEGALVLGLIEPISEAIMNAAQRLPTPVVVQLTSLVVVKASWPRGRQDMDEGRKALWNTGIISSKQAIFEPYIHLLRLCNLALQQGYEALDECHTFMASLAEDFGGFLKSSPGSQLHATLHKTQQGLALVIGDKDRLIVQSEARLLNLSLKILSLWQSVVAALKPLPSNETVLKALDLLIAAGLNSSHRAIVNVTVDYWNETFGQLDSLSYPARIELALRRIQPLVELDLPTFPRSAADQPSPLRDFVDSQSTGKVELMVTPSGRKGKSSKQGFNRDIIFPASKGTPTHGTRPEAHDGSSTPRQRRFGAQQKAKLRHDNSQLEFTAVQSSSPVDAQLETQLLTDHQKEVQSRQRFEMSNLYPDFSSSPGQRSPAAASHMRVLDFSARKVGTDGYRTPTLHNEEHGPMDDYVVSSPTPRAAQKMQGRDAEAYRGDSPPPDDVADSIDIPSSPPPTSEDLEGATINGQPDNDSIDAQEESAEQSEVVDEPEEEAEMPALDVKGDMDYTSAEPEQQAGSENGQAGTTDTKESHLQPTDKNDAFVVSTHPSGNEQDVEIADTRENADDSVEKLGHEGSSSPIRFSDSPAEPTLASVEGVMEDAVEGKPRDEVASADLQTGSVEDSFYESMADVASRSRTPERPGGDPGQDAGAASETPASSQKRKRRSESQKSTPAKRRKQSSPLKRIFSWVTGSQNDEDIAECIVVASQPEQFAVRKPEKAIEESSAPASAPPSMSVPDLAPAPVAEPAAVPEVSETSVARRTRGKAMKSDFLDAMDSSPAASTRSKLKRKSSALSNGGDDTEAVSTPRPRKAARITRSRSGKASSVEPTDASTDDATVEVPRTATRTAEAVVIHSSPRPQSQEAVEESSREDRSEDADSQLRTEIEAASQQPERKIAQPRSIIARLRSILADCRTLVLGSQEYRELDNVLFDVRREVHEAAIRGEEDS
ncbi:hypothetical protein AAFC00_000514 [Neodothiora populina]|uniref:Telomere-associated protein Rif1 N-terminal domain-containing protein n=1 Tax=Neodothiora populina TaxID=2781224 RepID=A0ABR3PD64_9PEZI